MIRKSERKLAAIKEIAVKKPEKIQQASTLLETMPPRYLLSATANLARKPKFGSEANLVGSAFPLKEWDHNETKYKVFFFIIRSDHTPVRKRKTYSILHRKL